MPLRSESQSERGSFSEPPRTETKKIGRKCPVLVDVIFILMQLGLALTFGFFSYYYVAIHRPCKAAYGSVIPLPPDGGATIGKDVQFRFKLIIRFGFYLSILNFIRVVVNQIGIWLKSPLLYYVAIVMYGVNFMLALVWFMFAQMWRWCYDGQVCSGDFLSAQEKDL
jgi:hypothetical protein